MPYEEKPASRRARVVRLVLAWIIGIPLTIVMWLWFSWVSLIILAGMVWASWDYYRKGDMTGSVDRGLKGVFRGEAFRDKEYEREEGL